MSIAGPVPPLKPHARRRAYWPHRVETASANAKNTSPARRHSPRPLPHSDRTILPPTRSLHTPSRYPAHSSPPYEGGVRLQPRGGSPSHRPPDLSSRDRSAVRRPEHSQLSNRSVDFPRLPR